MVNQLTYKYYHWGPLIFHTQITPDECQKLLEEGKKCRKKSNDHRSKLAGHLTEEYRLTDITSIVEWFNKYLKAYMNALKKWRGTSDPNYKTPSHRHLESVWINYMKSNDFNPPHTHGGDLSFVTYPSIPKEIIEENKAFVGNRNKGGGPGGVSWIYGEDIKHCISAIDHLPATGDLFIFPANIKHWVFPFRSTVERISVSGNVFFDKRGLK